MASNLGPALRFVVPIEAPHTTTGRDDLCTSET